MEVAARQRRLQRGGCNGEDSGVVTVIESQCQIPDLSQA